MNVRKLAALLGVAGLAAGAIGAGVGATYTDNATAVQNINVGTFGCRVSSTDSNAVISADGKSVTINMPPILSSASGNSYTSFTVSNTGSMTEVVHWTWATGGTVVWQPTGRMGFSTGTVANPLSTDLTLTAGQSHFYDSMGFMWAQLTNADLGATAEVTYTAHCGEVPPPPPPPVSKVQFVGLADATVNSAGTGTAAVTLPAGSTTGDIALVMTYGQTSGKNPQTPAGYTSLATNAGGSNMLTNLSYRVLVAGDTAVPAVTTGFGAEVAVYRGVAGIGAHTYNGGTLNNVGGTSYPLKCSALSLTKTDGSSWVVCMGGDGYATTNARTMVFDSNTTNRSASLPDIHTGLADTNAAVTSWATVGWTGDNFPLPGSHGVVVHSIELLSK